MQSLFVLLSIALTKGVMALTPPPGVQTWCGKAYRPENASFEPDGWLDAPTYSEQPLLDLRIRPQLNYYTISDAQASFIIDAGINHYTGVAFGHHGLGHQNEGGNETSSEVAQYGHGALFYQVTTSASRQPLAQGFLHINSTGQIADFSLKQINVQHTAIPISLTVRSPHSKEIYSAQTTLYYLPEPASKTSKVRIDSLSESLLVPAKDTPSTYNTLFPYSYYTSWENYLENNASNVQSFRDQGYNIVHVIPVGADADGFNFTEFEAFMDQCDRIGLWVMYDMRYTYQNHTSVAYQVNKVKDHPSLLLYYTGDEADGAGDPLNATKLTYDLIKSIDPYHPVSLCLNCYNYFYEDYSAGADIVMEDVYPVADNTSYSIVYDTVCNVTYGCCGCDDCHGNFQDISTRLDVLKDYQNWIGGAPKPRWGVPQAFGDSQWWTRNPNDQELTMMSLISINHGAKGLVAWTYPAADSIEQQTSKLANILTADKITQYITTINPVALEVTDTNGLPLSQMDAAAWTSSDGKTLLVSILNARDFSVTSSVQVDLGSLAPKGISAVQPAMIGTVWSCTGGSTVTREGGVGSLSADLFIVTLN